MVAVYTPGGEFMGRRLDTARLLLLLPELARRVRSPRLPFQVRLTFRTEEGEAAIVITADDVLVDGGANGVLVFELPERALARLRLGGFDPADVLARLPNRPGGGGCAACALPAADAAYLPDRPILRRAGRNYSWVLRFQPRRDRGQQARLLVVARQFPEHDAAQTLGEDVVGLAAD
jgi:hypothetical protein